MMNFVEVLGHLFGKMPEMFRRWIKNEHNCEVIGERARKWLHTLGFKQVNHTKGEYFNGHEREDVVMYRKTFVIDVECIQAMNPFCILMKNP